MAKAAGGARRPVRAQQTGQTQGSNVQVVVPVPQNTKITVTDLKSLTVEDVNQILEKAKTAQIGFVILNAPFKLRPIEPVS